MYRSKEFRKKRLNNQKNLGKKNRINTVKRNKQLVMIAEIQQRERRQDNE